jgi:hypothetical protein
VLFRFPWLDFGRAARGLLLSFVGFMALYEPDRGGFAREIIPISLELDWS